MLSCVCRDDTLLWRTSVRSLGLTEVEKAGGSPEMKLSGENQERTHLRDIHSIQLSQR